MPDDANMTANKHFFWIDVNIYQCEDSAHKHIKTIVTFYKIAINSNKEGIN